jgi:hypothetical protein
MGSEPVASYPGLDNSPVVTFWSESDPGGAWRPNVDGVGTGSGIDNLLHAAAQPSDLS